MTTRGQGKTKRRREGKGKGKNQGQGPAKSPIELQQRAMATVKRAADLAAAGIPAVEQLKARSVKFFARVEKKLEAVPPERQQPPPATIAAQAVLQYALLGDGPDVAELRTVEPRA